MSGWYTYGCVAVSPSLICSFSDFQKTVLTCHSLQYQERVVLNCSSNLATLNDRVLSSDNYIRLPLLKEGYAKTLAMTLKVALGKVCAENMSLPLDFYQGSACFDSGAAGERQATVQNGHEDQLAIWTIVFMVHLLQLGSCKACISAISQSVFHLCVLCYIFAELSVLCIYSTGGKG